MVVCVCVCVCVCGVVERESGLTRMVSMGGRERGRRKRERNGRGRKEQKELTLPALQQPHTGEGRSKKNSHCPHCSSLIPERPNLFFAAENQRLRFRPLEVVPSLGGVGSGSGCLAVVW
jgi:hypothetical protein